MEYKKAVCISHMEDVDGICSGSLIKQAFNTVNFACNYNNFMECLLRETKTGIDALFICDLGITLQTKDEFIDILSGLVKSNVDVTYIDHHKINKDVMNALTDAGVKLIHEYDDCTTIQVYETYKDKLQSNAMLLAVCAAVTDDMETSQNATKIMEKFDRQYVFANATIMTYYITANQDQQTLAKLIDKLAKNNYPSDIDIFKDARDSISLITESIKNIKKNIKHKKNLSYMYCKTSTSSMVSFVLAETDKNVALAYRQIDDKFYSMSIRGNGKHDLGKIANKIAEQLNGSGGGHPDSCGASIPIDNMEIFIKTLDDSLNE